MLRAVTIGWGNRLPATMPVAQPEAQNSVEIRAAEYV